MTKDPNQAIYDALFKISLNLGYQTFNYLPDSQASYPFVYFGEQFDTPIELKSPIELAGETNLTVHIYGEHNNRKLITDMSNSLIQAFKKISWTDIYSIGFADVNKQFIQDNSTTKVLWHAILDIKMNYCMRGRCL
ncbi:hypothetical protein [Bombilactobacillus mellifer]|uniref:hypothetical protein n=1 Tax=Bombilactobacillus mellifer TaxID=1218492 RepID=UPI0023F00409|nr:hypothetical protein [Bombilactobacillus mellifer]MCT6826978.1 hypothetical protein [Bombilactobacillus mellifer]